MRLQARNGDEVTHRVIFLRHAVVSFPILPWRSQVTLKLCGPRAGHFTLNRVARIPLTCVSGTAPCWALNVTVSGLARQNRTVVPARPACSLARTLGVTIHCTVAALRFNVGNAS